MTGWRKKQIVNSIEKDIVMGAAIGLVSQLLDKTQESFTVTRCTNGFIVEQSGRQGDDWKTVKLLCTDTDILNEVISDILDTPVE